MSKMRSLASLLLFASLAGAGLSLAQAPASRVRGEIVSVNGAALQLKADDGQTLSLRLSDRATVSARSGADVTRIVPGAFLGTTAVPGPDGTLVATEVHIFPESMRGTGEGHRPMDAATGSTMTNATVSSVASGQPSGRTMTNATVTSVGGDQERRMMLKYNGGEKLVTVPKGVPIVMVEAGDKAMLVPGAHVVVSGTTQGDGSLLVERIMVGKNGFVPPL
jgi:hypothetical protein